MAIAKTKMLINNKNGYLFYYEDYDDNGNLTDKGFHFYSAFSDDLTVSSNDGVYIDSVGTYTKDSDGNKVYHNMEVNTNNNFIYIQTDGTDLSEYTDMDINVNLGATTLDLTLNDDNFPNGVYEDDNDNYYLKIDLIVAKTLTFKSKADGYKLVDFSIPYTRELFNLFNIDFSYSNILEKIDLYDKKEPYKIEHIDKKFSDVNNNINSSATDITTDIEDVKTQITTDSTDIKTSISDNKDSIDKLNKDIIDSRIELISANGSSGAKYKDNSIVTIRNYLNQWKILSSFISTNERGILGIMYKVKGVADSNKDDIMIISQELITEFVKLDDAET